MQVEWGIFRLPEVQCMVANWVSFGLLNYSLLNLGPTFYMGKLNCTPLQWGAQLSIVNSTSIPFGGPSNGIAMAPSSILLACSMIKYLTTGIQSQSVSSISQSFFPPVCGVHACRVFVRCSRVVLYRAGGRTANDPTLQRRRGCDRHGHLWHPVRAQPDRSTSYWVLRDVHALPAINQRRDHTEHVRASVLACSRVYVRVCRRTWL